MSLINYVQRCIICDHPTDRELGGYLFQDDGTGPFCLQCWWNMTSKTMPPRPTACSAPPAKIVTQVPLLPCPFCGGRFIPEHPKMAGLLSYTSQPKLEELFAAGWRVCCYGCGVQTWDNLGYTKEQAVAAWNTRAHTPHDKDQP